MTSEAARATQARFAPVAPGAKRVILVALALAGTGACAAAPTTDAQTANSPNRVSTADRYKGSPDAAAPSAAVTPLYLGRFVFAAPAGATASLDDAVIDRILVRPAWRGPDSTAAQVWAARVVKMEADKQARPPGVPSVVQFQRQVDPHTRLLFAYANSEFPDAREALALIDRGSASVWLHIDYDRGLEDKVLAGVAHFAAAYHPEDGLTPRPEDAPAFHLPHAALRLPFGFEESLTAYVDGRSAGLRNFSISMQSRADREWDPGPIAEARAKAASALGAAMGVRMHIARAAPRTVAGLPGEEVVARLSSKDDPEDDVSYTWEYRGEDGVPLRPHVQIKASAPARHEAQATAAWDRLLSGARALPQPTTGASPGSRP